MLSSYKPCHSEVLVFIGAGATSCLGMPTTNKQEEMLKILLDENYSIAEKVAKIDFFKEREYCPKMKNFLTILDYSTYRWIISDEALEAAKNLFQDLILKYSISEDVLKNRILELREIYDLKALLKVAKICPDKKQIFHCYSILDKLSMENRAIQAKEGSELELIGPDRFRGARRCLTLLITTMFEIAWFKISEKPEYKKYKDFAKTFTKIMKKESIQFSEKLNLWQKKFSDKDFYLGSTAFVCFNFEIVFLRLLIEANEKLNSKPKAYLGNPAKSLEFRVDFGFHKFRKIDEKGNITEYTPFNDSVVGFANNISFNAKDMFRSIKFYFAHGSMNFRECPVCGRPTCYLGDEKLADFSDNMMPPLPMNLRNNSPKSSEEEAYQKRLHTDSLQCLFCGAETFAYSSPMIMQSAFKGIPTSFLEETQRDLKNALSKTRHIVLLGYSLPHDDLTWYESFGEAIRSSTFEKESEQPYCSIVVGYKGEKRWLYEKDFDAYIQKHQNLSEDKKAEYGITTLESVLEIFEKKHVRLWAGGIPQVFKDNTELDIKEFLYPTEFVDWGGSRILINK